MQSKDLDGEPLDGVSSDDIDGIPISTGRTGDDVDGLPLDDVDGLPCMSYFTRIHLGVCCYFLVYLVSCLCNSVCLGMSLPFSASLFILYLSHRVPLSCVLACFFNMSVSVFHCLTAFCLLINTNS